MKLEIDWTARDNSSVFKVQSYMKADFSDLVSAFQSRVYCLVFVVCVENLRFFFFFFFFFFFRGAGGLRWYMGQPGSLQIFVYSSIVASVSNGGK